MTIDMTSQDDQMKTTDPDQVNGLDYTRADGQIIFVHDLGSSNDGLSRDPELAGQYDIYDGTGLDVLTAGGTLEGHEPLGRITAPEPLPLPGVLLDLAEQFLDALGPQA